jgi:hypothetical protein
MNHHASRPLPEPPATPGGRITASGGPSKPQITGRLDLSFAQAFPESSRDHVIAEANAAAREFNIKVGSIRSDKQLRASRLACVKRAVRSFCREANLLRWGANRLDSQTRACFYAALEWSGLAEVHSGNVRPDDRPTVDDALLVLLNETATTAVNQPSTDASPAETLPALIGADATSSNALLRRGYREEIKGYMKEHEMKRAAMAKQCGVSVSTLQSIMSTKGKRRFGEDALRRVLTKVGHVETVIA